MADFDTPLTRENVLREMEVGWNELQTYLASLTEGQLTGPTDAAGWTAKDHVIHLAMWENTIIELLDGKPQRETLDIAPDIWEQGDDPINAVIQQRYQAMPLAEVMQTLPQVHERMVKKIETLTDADLLLPYRHYDPQATDDGPIVQWVLGDTLHHYRLHMTWIGAIVEQA